VGAEQGVVLGVRKEVCRVALPKLALGWGGRDTKIIFAANSLPLSSRPYVRAYIYNIYAIL
jgi:hypothetical protein